MYGNRFTPRSPPVKEGEEIDVRIEAVGEKGDGVAKKDGFVLFVPNVKEADEVRVRVTKVLRKVGFAEVIGQAQGPISDSAPKTPAPRSQAEEKARENEELVAAAQTAQSTEDFGEESEEEPDADESEDETEPEEEDEPVEEETTEVEENLDEEPEQEDEEKKDS